MDRKSILALILIAVVIILMPYYQKMIVGDKYYEQMARVKQDSVAQTAPLEEKNRVIGKEIKSAPVKVDAA